MMTRLQKYKNGILFVIAVVALVMALASDGMSSSSQLALACALLAGGALLGIVAFGDTPQDEREQELVYMSDRLGFLAGVAIAAIIILVGAINDKQYIWVEITLAIMVIVKLVANLYLSRLK